MKKGSSMELCSFQKCGLKDLDSVQYPDFHPFLDQGVI